MVRYIESKQEFQELMEQSKEKLVVIDFTASWCGPCQFIAPIFGKLAKENPTVIFVKVDVDETEDVAASCGITAMPTFQFYKGGKKVDELRGASKDALEQMIAKHK